MCLPLYSCIMGGMTTKLCTHCGEIKPRSEFYSKGDKERPNAVQSRCKTCANRARELRRAEGRTPRLGSERKGSLSGRKMRIKEKLALMRADVITDGCVVCGEKEPCCLHLHHLDPSTKEHKFSQLVHNGQAQAFIREIAKGIVVLCANCHAKVHANIIALPQVG